MHGSDFQLLMISAMYENGGNTTQRLLDGHPELFSYPFESQPGTRFVADHLTSLFPVKYRWPVFPLDGRRRGRLRGDHRRGMQGPHQDAAVEQVPRLPDRARRRGPQGARSSPAWPASRGPGRTWSRRSSGPPPRPGRTTAARGQERMHVGYSPIIVVDADKIVRDLPTATCCTSSAIPGRLRRHEEAGGAAVAGPLHHRLVHQPAGGADLRATCSRTASTCCASRTSSSTRLASSAISCSRSACRDRETLRDAELERQAARPGLPLGHDPHADDRGEPRHRQRADARREGGDRRPDPAAARRPRVRELRRPDPEVGMTGPVLVTGGSGSSAPAPCTSSCAAARTSTSSCATQPGPGDLPTSPIG